MFADPKICISRCNQIARHRKAYRLCFRTGEKLYYYYGGIANAVAFDCEFELSKDIQVRNLGNKHIHYLRTIGFHGLS